MDVNRRSVLKGMALSSIAGLTAGNSARALGITTAAPAGLAAGPSLFALVNEDTAASAFLHGAIAASGPRLQVQRIGCDLDFMLSFERQLRASQTTRIIGLLDDAAATLVVDLARSAGARVQWLGQHTARAGYTRHHLLNASIAESCSRQLARQLHACGVGFHIFEERQGNMASQRQLSAPPRGGEHMAEWASSIGYLLASFSTQPTVAAPAPFGNVVAEGSFVSFSIEA